MTNEPQESITESNRCAKCGITIPGGYLCLPDVDTMRGIFGELAGWAAELRERAPDASGLRGIDYAAMAERRGTRVHAATPMLEGDDSGSELAAKLEAARQMWLDEQPVTTADRRTLAVWDRGPDCLRAMLVAERAALGVLDGDELVRRVKRRTGTAAHNAAARLPRGLHARLQRALGR